MTKYGFGSALSVILSEMIKRYVLFSTAYSLADRQAGPQC